MPAPKKGSSLADIFISYARTDRAQVEVLAEALLQKGLEIWWDRQIIGGEDFSANIERELEAAGAVVVAWSATSSASHWVKDEAAFAAGAGKLVAISLDGTLPPMGFRQFHVIDFAAWSGNSTASAFSELIRAVQARLETAPSPEPTVGAVQTNQATASTFRGPWIAVTPIKVRGNDEELIDLADDLANSFASGLARFSYLNVATQASAAAGKQAGARYVLEATLRKAGSTLRLSIQLRSTNNEKQVWGENYNRPFDSDAIFEIHDDLTDHVVCAVADPYGALMRDLSAPVASIDPEAMTPYEALLRQFIFRQRVTEEDHAISHHAIKLAVQRSPGNADLISALAFSEIEGYINRLNEKEATLEKGLAYARQAVEINPYSAYAHFALFQASYFSRDKAAARNAARRSLELNPRDSDAMAMIGILTAYMGDWDYGLSLVERAIKLNQNAPGWYWMGPTTYHFHKGDYQEALDSVRRANMPQYAPYNANLAIMLAELGRPDEAKAAVQAFHASWNQDLEAYKENILRWFWAQPDLMEKFECGLRKAGMDLP